MNWAELKKGRHFIFNSCCDDAVKNIFAIYGINYINIDVSLKRKKNKNFVDDLIKNNEDIVFYIQTKNYCESIMKYNTCFYYFNASFVYKDDDNDYWFVSRNGVIFELKQKVVFNKKILVFLQ